MRQLICIRALNKVKHIILNDQVLRKGGTRLDTCTDNLIISEWNLPKVVNNGQEKSHRENNRNSTKK